MDTIFRSTFRGELLIIGSENRKDGPIKGRNRTITSVKYQVPSKITFGFTGTKICSRNLIA